MSEGESLLGKKGSRFEATVHACVTKVFLAGFCWQLFGLLSGRPARSVLFALATGAGDAVGVFVGSLFSLNPALLLATASFFTGALWQPSVNLDFDFLFTCLVVGLVSTTAFLIAIRTGRLWLPERTFTSDVSLALSIAGAEVFFVTTTAKSPFGFFIIHDDTPLFEASCLAGTTTFFGFFLVQSLQNLAPWQLWCDK